MQFRVIKYKTPLLFFLFTQINLASVNKVIPLYHWSYQYIDLLQSNGLCQSLSETVRPYLRGEVAASVSAIETDDPVLVSMIVRLKEEFSEEIEDTDKHFNQSMDVYGRQDSYLDHTQTNKGVYRGIYRGGVGITASLQAYLFTNVVFNQYDYNSSNYAGYKWRGFAGYTEQAYLNYKKRNFSLKFGRDFIYWGVGHSNTLALSNQNRTMDHLLIKWKYKWLHFSYFHAELDPLKKAEEIESWTYRYLSGHRVDMTPWPGRLTISISEVLLYGGPGKGLDMTYLNPFIFYHGAHKNKKDPTNVLPTLDIILRPKPWLKCYSSLLIDDIQLEKTRPGDLEPNEIGFIGGVQWSKPFNCSGVVTSLEYVRIANRTYKTPSTWETFIFRNEPLGHPLGNDFDLIDVGFSKIFSNQLLVDINYRTIRKGEGDIYTDWDEPWLEYSVDEGYTEKFPSGVVEKRNEIVLGIQYHYSPCCGLDGKVSYISRKNVDHVEGERDSEVHWRIGFWWQGSWNLL